MQSMTAQEKKRIFNLIKTSSSWICGYESLDFKNLNPEFLDDVEAEPLELPKDNTIKEQSLENPQKGITLEALSVKIQNCSNCILCKTRTNTVLGEGSEKPLVLVIGEGPGEEEDKTGRPFVGPAGQLLDKMLGAIQLSRTTNCYIANIVKCRPPHNRTPMPDEASACSGYLQAQIHILKPKMILAMGRTAVQNLLNTDQGINALRGKFFDLNGIPLMATYHPSALLHDESLKRPAWEDLKAFKLKLKELEPEYDKLS